MHIQIERAAEALDQRHCPGRRARARNAGLADQMTRDRPVNDTEHPRDDLGTGCQQIPQRKRQRQHSLADRLARQGFVHEQGRRLGHPPASAERIKPQALTEVSRQADGRSARRQAHGVSLAWPKQAETVEPALPTRGKGFSLAPIRAS